MRDRYRSSAGNRGSAGRGRACELVAIGVVFKIWATIPGERFQWWSIRSLWARSYRRTGILARTSTRSSPRGRSACGLATARSFSVPAGASRSRGGELHATWNAGSVPARMIEIISPAGFEHFFREVSQLIAVGPSASSRVLTSPNGAACSSASRSGRPSRSTRPTRRSYARREPLWCWPNANIGREARESRSRGRRPTPIVRSVAA